MKTFDTVAKLKLAKLKAGQFVETGGYYAKGDAGAAKYFIVAPQAFDGYGDHELANSTIAVLQGTQNESDVTKWGALTGGTAGDNTPAVIAAGLRSTPLIISGDYAVNATITFLNDRVVGGGRLIFDLDDSEDGAIVKCGVFDVKVKKLVPATSIVDIGDNGGQGIVYRERDCVSNVSDSEGFSNAITVSSNDGAITVSLLTPRMVALGRGLTIPSGGDTIVSTVNVIGNLSIQLGDDGIIDLPVSVGGLDGILLKYPNVLNINGATTIKDAIEHGAYLQSVCTINGDYTYSQVNMDGSGDGLKVSNPDLVLGHTATITHTGKIKISGCKTGLLSEFATKDMVFGDIEVDLTQHNSPVDGVRLTNAVNANADVSEHVSMGNVRIKVGGAARLGFSNKLDGVSTIGDIVVEAIAGASTTSLIDLSPRNDNDSIITEIKSINAIAVDVGNNPIGIDIGSGNGSGKVHIGSAESNTTLRVLGSSSDNIVISSGNLKTGVGDIMFNFIDKTFGNAEIRPQGLEAYANSVGYAVKNNAIVVGWAIDLTENPSVINDCEFKIKSSGSTLKTIVIDSNDFVDGKLTGSFDLANRVGYSDGDTIGISFNRLTMQFGSTATPFALTLFTI